MDKRIKAKWVKALRSGKYKQSRSGCLKDGDEYCCLGVLADITLKRFNETASYLSASTSKRVGLAPITYGANGVEDASNPQSILAKKNDGGQSFNRIATWIEKNL